MLWTEHLCLLQIHRLILGMTLRGRHLGSEYVIRVEPSLMGSVSLEKRFLREFCSPLRHGKTQEKVSTSPPPPMSQEEGIHQTPNLSAPWFWTFHPAELWELNVCSIFVMAAWRDKSHIIKGSLKSCSCLSLQNSLARNTLISSNLPPLFRTWRPPCTYIKSASLQKKGLPLGVD